MKKLFLLLPFLTLLTTDIKAQTCNRPTPSDNACSAPTFCSTTQMHNFCSTIPSPVFGKTYMAPNGFCGSLESPSWFKFVAETSTLSLQFSASGCGTDGVQAVILSTTNCNDSAAYKAMSNCVNATGGQQVATVNATGLVAGETYYLLIDGYQGAGCSYDVDVLTGAIRTVNTISTPSVLFGPTSFCNTAVNATYSVPRNNNASEYTFAVTINGVTNTFVQSDSFYTVPSFPAAGTARVCASYRNDCAVGTPVCLDINLGSTAAVTLPTVYLCPGEIAAFPDGTIVDNATPPADDQTQSVQYIEPGVAGCDTTFTVSVVRYASRESSRAYFLKSTEGVTVGNAVFTPNADCSPYSDRRVLRGGALNGCDSIVDFTIYNAKQNLSITPSSVNLNCSTAQLRVLTADSCADVVHLERYTWLFQTNASSQANQVGNTQVLNINTAGIYTVIVRDSVFYGLQPSDGYRIFTDTLRITVTGTGAPTTPPQPGLINGVLAQSVCQGDTQRFTIRPVPDASRYDWVTTNGQVISGQGDTSVVIRWTNNASRDTIRVTATNGCNASNARLLPVSVVNFTNLSAGSDTSICGGSVNLNASTSSLSGGGTGSWTALSGNPGTASFSNANQPNATVTVSTNGTYRFVWSEQFNSCGKSDTIVVRFSELPQFNNVVDSCSIDRQNIFVRFNIATGAPPFTVTNLVNNTSTTVNNLGLYRSNALPTGNYQFRITDSRNCTPNLVSGTQRCNACNTRAGSMDLTQITVCQGDTARGIYLGGYVSDGNDTLQFVLHTGNPRTGIVARSYRPNFAFQNGMSFNTVYFISAIAGDDSLRQVRLNDACFDGSQGTPVIFRARPTARMIASDTALCAGTCANITFVLNGQSPFEITARVTQGATTRDTAFLRAFSGFVVPFCPSSTGSYRLLTVRDSFGCADLNLTQQITFNVFPSVTAGTAAAPLSICNNLDTIVNLNRQITGATPGGRWIERSTVNSSGGAFNAAAGTFRTVGQAAATYRFGYVVTPTPANSPCKADTAYVTINLLPTPTADAGVDDTIKCSRRIVRIGGDGTTTGNGITVLWSGGVSGNAPKQEVAQPGTFVLTVSSASCIDRDTVTVFIDTLAPSARVTPVTDTLTCARPSILLDGSRSTPIGQIDYLWYLNGIPFDNNPISEARVGGQYQLTVTRRSNGCTALDSFTVVENRILPKVAIAKPISLSCRDTVVTIDATASDSGSIYTIRWRAQNGGRFAADSTTLRPSVNRGGQFQLYIRNSQNACADSSTITVAVDTVRPRAIAFATDTIDCLNTNVAISGRGSTLGVGLSYIWRALSGNIVSGETTLNPIVDDAGQYELTVRNDKNGCFAIDTIEVVKNNARPRGIAITVRKPTCYGECDASLRIDSVSGGTRPFLYSLDGKVYTTRSNFANLCATTLRLYVQDAGGCQTDTTFSIIQDKQLAVSLGPDTIVRLGDSIFLNIITNADSVRQTKWSFYADSACSRAQVCLGQWVKPTQGTVYSVSLTDGNGCKVQGRVAVSIDKDRPVFIPSAFSPNNDGQNDILYVNSSQVVKSVKSFRVFDRWGQMVFEDQNFPPNDPTHGWNGRFREKELMPGVYAYIIELEYLDGATEFKSGDVTLLR